MKCKVCGNEMVTDECRTDLTINRNGKWYEVYCCNKCGIIISGENPV